MLPAHSLMTYHYSLNQCVSCFIYDQAILAVAQGLCAQFEGVRRDCDQHVRRVEESFESVVNRRVFQKFHCCNIGTALS